MHGQCNARPAVTFPSTGVKLYCLVIEARVWTTCLRLLLESGTAENRTRDLLSHKSNALTVMPPGHRYYAGSQKWRSEVSCFQHTHTHTRLTALCLGLPGWAGTRKVKPIWSLLKQETVSGSGISWAIRKPAPRSRQITTPAPHHSVFYGLDALPAAQPTASKHWRQKESANWWIDGRNWLRCIACVFSNSDDNLLKNIELFDKLSLRFNGRILFIKDVIGSQEICCWSYYGHGQKIAEVCCTSIVYGTDKKHTKVWYSAVWLCTHTDRLRQQHRHTSLPTFNSSLGMVVVISAHCSTEHSLFLAHIPLGFGSFTVAGTRVWNSLLATIRQITSYGQFRQHLKTFIQGLETAAHCDSWLLCTIQILLLTCLVV